MIVNRVVSRVKIIVKATFDSMIFDSLMSPLHEDQKHQYCFTC